MSNWFHVHTHSKFSCLDGMSDIDRMVEKTAKDGRPAIALTDHGNMSGTIQLYKSAKKHGVLPYPGMEGYLVPDGIENKKDANRFHIGLLALNYDGYKGLVKLSTLSHQRENFQRFPLFDLTHLAELAEECEDDIAVTTGCFFGYVQQTLVNRDEKTAKRIVEMYARWFPNTFVEVQNHNIDHGSYTDADLVEKMIEIADEVGLPVVATQDAHYCDQTEKPAHALMKRMVYGSAEDNEFPGDSFHLASEEWVQDHYRSDQWDRACEGAEQLLSLHALSLPALESYKPRIPSITKDPAKWLRKFCFRRLKELGLNKPKYEQRLEHELAIINNLNTAGYFECEYQEVEWCKRQKICIEARGSAIGSLVCFLLGISQADPLKWGLLFERFMSNDRMKPPDIDMDIEDTGRPQVIDHIGSRFSVLQIGTYSELGARDDDDRGSVLVSYIAGKRRDKNANHALLGSIQSIEDVRRHFPEDYVPLRRLSKMQAHKSYGVHAAGVLMAGNDQKIEDYVPAMLVASSGTMVTQFTQDDVEELGYLKMDWLGQTTLTAMRVCQELIGREDPTDFTWIPDDDKAACKILREGRTENGIFHFEGYAKAIGGRELGIRTTKDAVLATALYMPGAMESGQKDLYVERRRNPDARRHIKYLHPIFEKHLKETYGTVIFQEQVINIWRDLGLSYESINKLLKVVKDSGKGAVERNRERMEALRAEFDGLCEKIGLDPEPAWRQTAGFVSYGFNQAHATGYGIRSYRCAYLKAHYPLEFMTGLLIANAGKKKEPMYVREARRIEIRILPPDVNVSEALWTLDRKKKAIRRGLMSIPKVGYGAAMELAENAPYADLDDLIERTDSRIVTGSKEYLKDGRIRTLNGVLGALRTAGALASLGIGRAE